MNDLLHRIAFGLLRGINRTLAESILQCVGSETNFFTHSRQQLIASIGHDSRLFANDYRQNLLKKAEQELAFIEQHRVTPLYYNDCDFPSRLADCEDAPIMLYATGNSNLNEAHVVSIVGTRHATPYGIGFTERLVEDMAEKIDGLVIVSGLAYGIDIAAHRTALRCGVPTVAVLAHGLNTIYPAAHRNIAVQMVESGGALLTEYTSTDAIHRGNFVARNRIVAAMSDCTIVAESASKGGALITARLASGYCRDVFALPGRSSDRYSAGCNKLIASNVAALVENADDVISAMSWTSRTEGTQTELFTPLSPEEQTIVDYLQEKGEGQVNTMGIQLGIPMARLMSLLIDLEFQGTIVPFPGGKYRLS